MCEKQLSIFRFSLWWSNKLFTPFTTFCGGRYRRKIQVFYYFFSRRVVHQSITVRSRVCGSSQNNTFFHFLLGRRSLIIVTGHLTSTQSTRMCDIATLAQPSLLMIKIKLVKYGPSDVCMTKRDEERYCLVVMRRE